MYSIIVHPTPYPILNIEVFDVNTKEAYNIKVVKRSNHVFFHTLRDKMMWGADGRG